MTTKLYAAGGTPVTVRDPDAQVKARLLVGTRERALTGAMLSDIIATKATWQVTWAHLTSAQWSTLGAEIARTVSMTWYPVDETSTAYTVTVADWQVEMSEFGWTCTARIEES